MPHMQQADILNTAGLITRIDNLVREHPDFEVLCDPCVSGYCFRYLPNDLAERQDPQVQVLLDDINKEIVESVQREGFMLVTKTQVDGRAAIRILIGCDRDVKEDIDAMFEAIARWGLSSKKQLSPVIS